MAVSKGPYFGQWAWFKNFHPEKIQSVQERYFNEMKRINKVIDGHLKQNGTGWLVGDKCTYADIAFLTWNVTMIGRLFGESEMKHVYGDIPDFMKWYEAMMARPAIKKCLEERKRLVAARA